MIREIYIKLLKNVKHLLQGTNILIYTDQNESFLKEYLQACTIKICNNFIIPEENYDLIILENTLDIKFYSVSFINQLLNKNCPIITSNLYKPDNKNYYVYDAIKTKFTTYYTLRPFKHTTSFLNFYIRFQENSKYNRFLDNDQVVSFSDLLYEVASSFYDIKARMVYPFDTGGHSGCFILGESHFNWHTYPEDGRLDINISSCTNRNAIPLLKQALIDMFKVNPEHIYSDYKEIDVHFH